MGPESHVLQQRLLGEDRAIYWPGILRRYLQWMASPGWWQETVLEEVENSASPTSCR